MVIIHFRKLSLVGEGGGEVVVRGSVWRRAVGPATYEVISRTDAGSEGPSQGVESFLFCFHDLDLVA